MKGLKDIRNQKLIAKQSHKNLKFNWELIKAAFSKTNKIKLEIQGF